jgi:serine/threonine protein kinase
MLREIKVLKDYTDKHVVQLHDVFRERGKLHLVFDYEQRNLLEELQL